MDKKIKKALDKLKAKSNQLEKELNNRILLFEQENDVQVILDTDDIKIKLGISVNINTLL